MRWGKGGPADIAGAAAGRRAGGGNSQEGRAA
jgi:hypothetical protein